MASLTRGRLALMTAAAAAAAAAFLAPAAQAGTTAGVLPNAGVLVIHHLPGEYPESIALDRWGNTYLGLFLKGQILRITPLGRKQVLTTFPAGSQTLGVRVGPGGEIYAAVANTDPAHNGVWAVAPDGRDQHEIAAVPGFPNGLLFDGSGNLFVSDSIGGAVYRIRHGEHMADLWSDSPLLAGTAGKTQCGTHFSGLAIGANGLAFGSSGDLLVANTTESDIVRIPVRPDGTAGTASLFVPPDCRLWGADGMATDHWGNLYVAANAAEKIVRVSPSGSVRVLAAKSDGDPLHTPSDLAFGPGWWERSDLFISNFALAYPGGAEGGVAELPLGFTWPFTR